MWQNNALLARRLLHKELEPSVVLNMSPKELKVNFCFLFPQSILKIKNEEKIISFSLLLNFFGH